MAYLGREPIAGEVIVLDSIESQFNGSLTTFNLTRQLGTSTVPFYPVSSEQLLVSLGGVIQRPDRTGNVGFYINTDEIVFAVAPPAGTSCFIVSYGNIIDIGTPADNSVTTTKIADGSVTPAKLSTGGPYWDTSGNLGIGTSSPAAKLDVNGSTIISSTGAGPLNLFKYGTAAPTILMYGANGTAAAPTQTLTGDVIGGLNMFGYGSSGWAGGPSVRITGIATENNGTTINRGADIRFETVINGSTAIQERMRLTNAGNLGIGTSSPSEKLEVVGNLIVRSDTSNLLIYNPGTGFSGTMIANDSFHTALNGKVVGTDGGTGQIVIGGTITADTSGSNFNIGIGYGSSVNGTECIAIGRNAVAAGNRSVAIGYNSNAPDGTTVIASNGSERLRIDSTGRLLIGTSNSRRVGAANNASIQIEGIQSTIGALSVVQNSSNSFAPGRIVIGRSKSQSVGGNTIVANGDRVGELQFAAADGVDLFTPVADIRADLTGTPAADDMPGSLIFSTTSQGENFTRERVRITSTGNVGIGTSSPSEKLEVVGNVTASRLISNVAQGTAPLTVTSTTVVTNLNADLLDGQQGSYYQPASTALTTSTTFGGDVSGTYNAIVVSNDSHTHAFDNLTGKTSGTGDYATTGDLVAGSGSGSIALTINDGYGNSNITFNHQNGLPDQNGNAARIEVNTDSTSGASMNFELKSNVTANTAVTLTSTLNLTETTATLFGNTIWHAGNDGSGSGLDADLLDGENLDDSAATANTVVGRNASGDIFARLIRQTFADQATISGGMVFRINNSTDNYLRVCNDTGAIRTFLNVPTRTGSDASGTWGINITGNAATVTNGLYTNTTFGGDVSGTYNAIVIADDSHNHIISNVDGLQTALDGKLSTSDKAADSNLLDGLDSTQFLRSDAASTGTGLITLTNGLNVTGGNVGIGTSTPQYNLDVNGNINFTGTFYQNGTQFVTSRWTSGTGDDIYRLNGNVGIGTSTPTNKLEVNGSFAATTKSFVIPHPTKEGMKLRYGSLEGPENGVYVRGKTTESIISLPDYWTGLVDEETITVNLTPKNGKLHSVVKVIDNTVEIKCVDGDVDCYFMILGERKDVDKLKVEY